MLLLAGGLIAGLAYSSYADSTAYDPYLEEFGEPNSDAIAGVVIGGLLSLAGMLATAVAVVAKGVQLGNNT